MLTLWTLGLLTACEPPPPPDDRGAHAEALALLATPTEALAACRTIDSTRAPSLAADCRWAIAEALAPDDPAGAGAACADLTALNSLAAEECWFIVAEGSGDGAACDKAGRFEQDCRMHLLTRAALRWPRDLSVTGVAVKGLDAINAAGLSSDDQDAWMAAYRVTAARQPPPLDRPACLVALTRGLREACQAAAEGVFHDRLNRARDRGMDLCEGELPDQVAYVPDAALDRILAERRAADLCDPDAVRPPPPNGAP